MPSYCTRIWHAPPCTAPRRCSAGPGWQTELGYPFRVTRRHVMSSSKCQPTHQTALVHCYLPLSVTQKQIIITVHQRCMVTEFVCISLPTALLQARDAKLAREQAQLTANRHPSMSVGSRRILAQNPSLDHFMPLHATLTVSSLIG